MKAERWFCLCIVIHIELYYSDIVNIDKKRAKV